MGKKLKPTTRLFAYLPRQTKQAIRNRDRYSDPAKGKQSFLQGCRDYLKGLRRL